MMRPQAGVFPLGVSFAAVWLSAGSIGAADVSAVGISLEPASDVVVAWADGSYDARAATLDATAPSTIVLTNTANGRRAPAAITVTSDPAAVAMVTLTSVTGPVTHMASVMNPTGRDVLRFGPSFALDGGESVAVTVEATPTAN